MELKFKDIKEIILKLFNDRITCRIILGTFVFYIISLFISILMGIFVIFFYLNCCALCVLLFKNPKVLESKFRAALKYHQTQNPGDPGDCNVCSDFDCSRKPATFVKEPWKQIKISKVLDDSIDSFFSQVLKNFVQSWFSSISHDKNFTAELKQNLREAVCRLILRCKDLDYPVLLTNKLLPIAFTHFELLRKISVEDKVPMDKVVNYFVQNEFSIHPATVNRQTELNYLRDLSKFIIPQLLATSCKPFFSLLKELLACWVLLPTLDAACDSNLLNLLVILATNSRTNDGAETAAQPSDEKVIFLENFVKRNNIPKIIFKIEKNLDENILDDQQQLYAFMQYLKHDGTGVEILKFYLDVNHLNNELNDPRITSDPTKLSALQQQSETLLNTYRKVLFKNESRGKDLNDAFEHVKNYLKIKWKTEFCKSLEYFSLIYGDNLIRELESPSDPYQSAPTQTFSKLRASMSFKGAVDGVEATEIPIVWDGFYETQSVQNTNYYSSVAVKLRKERGQNLDSFMQTLLNSVEQSVEHGEDPVQKLENDKPKRVTRKPGNNLMYGNLFDLKTATGLVNHESPFTESYTPSKSVIYLLVKILKVPSVVARMVVSVNTLMKNCIDSLICNFIRRTASKLLDAQNLAKLIGFLEEKIFGEPTPPPTAQELNQRRELAHARLENLKKGSSETLSYLQSPILNKHLIYCLFDVVLCEVFPEIVQNFKDKRIDAKEQK